MAKFTDVISGLTESTDPQGDSDYIVGYDGTSVVKYLINNLPFATSTLALDELGAPSDSTSLNASTDAHGLLPKLSGDSDTYLNGVGGWAEVSGSGGGFTTGDIHMVELYRGELTTDGNFSDTDISQDYDHIKIYLRARSSVSATEDGTRIYFNNDATDGNYSRVYHGTVNATIYSGRADNPDFGSTPGATSTANDFGFTEIDIINYSDTTKVKTAKCSSTWRNDASNQAVFYSAINWESTAAISQITIQPDGYATDKFVAGSFCQIVGIKTEA